MAYKYYKISVVVKRQVSCYFYNEGSSMKKTTNNFILLCVIFATCLIIANIVASKVLTLNIYIFGELMVLPCGIICYPITYLVTDIVNEIWGKKEANKVVVFGLIAQLIATILIVIGRFIPALDSNTQSAYVTILGQNWFFVLASFASYLVSQFLDVFIFNAIRNRWIKKHTNLNKGKWIWNNLSTLTSQLLDTVIFTLIAFGFGYGWIFNNVKMLFVMIFTQYIFKAIIALLDTPFFYFFTRRNKTVEQEVEQK